MFKRIKHIWVSVINHEKTKFVHARCKDNLRKAEAHLNKHEPSARAISFIKANRRIAVLALIISGLLIVAGNFIFPLRKSSKELERIVRVDSFTVKAVDFTDELLTMGLVRGAQTADLNFQTSGVLKSIDVKEAASVKQGDILARLDDTDARLKVEYNQSKVMAAQKKYEVHKQLYELKTIIQAKYEEVQYEYESQQKELEFAKAELEKTKLRAPMDGMVGPFDINIGESVNPHLKVVSVFGLGSVYVDAGIIEKDVSKIHADAAVKIAVDAYPGILRDGKVLVVSPVVEGKSRNFRVRIEAINDDPGHLFLPGMFARARIEVYKKAGALVVPAASVKDDMVYIIKDGKAVKQAVKSGYKSYDYVEILEGVKDGDEIIAEVDSDLAQDTKVEIMNKREYTRQE